MPSTNRFNDGLPEIQVSSARRLPLLHAAKVLRAQQRLEGSQDDTENRPPVPLLPPDKVQLSPYFSPALEPGEYAVEVQQDIEVPSTEEKKKLLTKQTFN